jgi:hypothetical protein
MGRELVRAVGIYIYKPTREGQRCILLGVVRFKKYNVYNVNGTVTIHTRVPAVINLDSPVSVSSMVSNYGCTYTNMI